ncbi:MAG: hypothetical protein M1816_002788 [Peltula sp. TS41687]|nr:MAG: hypothetical protein M1816_002788 [Peltula sp. TS41687]
MSNLTLSDLPPLAQYTLKHRPPLLPPISDKTLTLILPIVAYWILSLFFHFIDIHDYLPQYRLHTPAEVLKRNRASPRDVVRDVIVQQIIQTGVGYLLNMFDPDAYYGDEMYHTTVWAQRIRLVQRAIPRILALVGIDGVQLAGKLHSYPQLAGAISGGHYLSLWDNIRLETGQEVLVPAFAGWEIIVAKALYWFIVPAAQFAVAIFVVDTWQYFLHRAMHMNQWLYRTFHSRHHRLYVPYAFGALYNHPFEGLLLDTIGAAVAYKIAGLSIRQGICFFTGSTFKTVDDHCGYALPWDPLQMLTSNNAAYHDIHHQSWGIKTNFSQPFFTFWDRLLGTAWSGGDVSARYERTRMAAEQKMDLSTAVSASTIPESPDDSSSQIDSRENDSDTPRVGVEAQLNIPPGKATEQARDSMIQVLQDKENGGASVLAQEAVEEKEAQTSLKRNAKKTVSSASQAGSLRSLSDRVQGSLHGRAGAMIGLESSH